MFSLRHYFDGPWWINHPDIPVSTDLTDYYCNQYKSITQTETEIKVKPNDETICPKCQIHSWGSDVENGIYFCYSCGYIGEAWIDQSQELRFYPNQSSNNSRVGGCIHEDFRKSALSTCIKGSGNEAFRRIQRYQSMDTEERRLYQNYKLLNHQEISPIICEKAKQIFKSIQTAKSHSGGNRRTNMAACVFLANDKESSQKVLNQLSSTFSVESKKIHKISKISRELVFQKHANLLVKPINGIQEIERIQRHVGPIPPSWLDSANELATIAKEYGLGLHAIPSSLAIGCLWWIYQEVKAPWTKEQLAQADDCSAVTVQRSFQLLYEQREIIQHLRCKLPDLNETIPKSFIQNTLIANAMTS